MELVLSDKLGNLHSVFIDFEDLEIVNRYTWTVTVPPVNNSAYVQSAHLGSLHRYILKHYMDIDGYEIDHRNRNGLDNRKENLRLATSQENKYNRRNWGAVEYVGVYKSKNGKRFEAAIKPDTAIEQVVLGIFDTKEEAAKIYDICALYYFKEFAHLNFPDRTDEYIKFHTDNLEWFQTPSKLRALFSVQIQTIQRNTAKILELLTHHQSLTTNEIVQLSGIKKMTAALILKKLVKSEQVYVTTTFIDSAKHYLYSLQPFGTSPKTRKYEIGTKVRILRDHNKSLKNKIGIVVGYEGDKISVEVESHIIHKPNTAIEIFVD